MTLKKDGQSRVWLIDEVRGLSIILMVIYHLFFDLVFIYGVDIPIFYAPGMNLIRDCFAGLFIFISGTACRFSHNNFKRGIYCFACGMLLTVVTAIVTPKEIILFGILHMLGIAMILFGLLRKLLDRIRPPWVGILIFSVFFLLCYPIPQGQFGPFPLPDTLYQTSWLFPLGFPSATFFSSDYFPLFPWVLLFFCGAYFGVYVKEGRVPNFFYRTHCKPLAVTGRYTLYIYLLHQPIVYGILYLFFGR